MKRRPYTAIVLFLIAVASVVIGILITQAPSVQEQVITSAPAAQSQREKTYTIAAVGDMVCAPTMQVTALTCQMDKVAAAVKAAQPIAVLLLGDIQYDKGELANFTDAFDKYWGDQAAVLKPAPGNHEYVTPNAEGYYTYFEKKNVETGDSGKGYYAFTIGDWRIISLNSNCEYIGGCGEGSAQAQWLRQELASNTAKCTAAYWHHPVFSSGPHGLEEKSNVRGRYFWQLLQKAGTELVLVGHDHDFERFAPQMADGTKDNSGIRQFVVGTGGKSLYPTHSPLAANSEFSDSTHFGYLKLELGKSSYDWEFVTIDGKVLDSGSSVCK